jgi:hypothetical protein
MAISTDVIYRVWCDNEGAAIDVGPDADALGLVWLRNFGAKSVDFFGKVDITFDPGMARAIGEGLIAAADEAERTK